jgi:hypothetical protein
MSDRVLIPLPGIGTLSLTREAYEAALAAGAALAASPAPSATPAAPKLLSAEAMEAATGVPASWFATQARERRIPFRKLGRYVRFDFAEVMDSEAMQRRAIPPGQLNCTGSSDRKGRASA